jgi:hypothetical protein
MASYQQNYDPRSYQFKPYDLPYQGIMKQIQAKTQYWTEGAEKVKDAYQNAAGLELSLDGNRQALKGFMDQANEQVSKAAKSDLSDPDNIQSAMSILNLYIQEIQHYLRILWGDHAITTRARDISNQYNELRTKNGGKNYSDVNKQYSLDAYNEFIKGNDPTAWKQHYQNLKDVQPYYDYKSELDKSIQACKSTTTTPGVNGMYMTSNEHTGINAGCLSASLSPNAERQMQIEGYVKYGKNYQALRDVYAPTLIADRQHTATNRAVLAAKLLDTKLDDASKQAITQQLSNYDDSIHNMDRSIDKLHNNDLSDIINNYETIAGATLKGQKINAISSVFSDKNTIKADPVQMMIARFKQDQTLLNQKEKFDLFKDQYDWSMKTKLAGKKLNANGELEDDMADVRSYTPIAAPDAIQKDFQTHENDIRSTEENISSLEKSLYANLKADPKYTNLLKSQPGTPEFTSFLNTLKENGDNPIQIQEILDKRANESFKRGILLQEKEIISNSPASKEAYKTVADVANSITRGESLHIRSDDGHFLTGALSARQLKSLVVNGVTDSPEGMIKLDIVTKYAPNGSQFGEHVLNVGGKNYPISGTQLSKYILSTNNEISKYQDVLNSQYKEHYASQHPYLSLKDKNDDTNIDPLRNEIGGALAGVIGAGPKDANKMISLIGSRFDGDVVFSVGVDKDHNQKGKPYDIKDIRNAMGKLSIGAQGVDEVEGVPNTYVIHGVPEYDKKGSNDIIQRIQDFGENMTRLKQQTGQIAPRTPFPEGYKGYSFTAMPNVNGGIRYEIKSKDGKTTTVENASELKSAVDMLEKLKNQEKK